MTKVDEDKQFNRLESLRGKHTYLFTVTDAAYWSARPIEEIEREIKRRQAEDAKNN